MNANSTALENKISIETRVWQTLVAKHQNPSPGKAAWQLINTLGPYAVLWYLIYHARAVSWWITLPLAILAGAFLVRVFIIFHDCGHGSFFKSRVANHTWGFLCGLLTFTPFHHWRWEHSLHHATSGDLDRRGVGDLWTMTVQEYLKASRAQRLAYRLARNPFILFLLGPLYLFAIGNRWPKASANRRDRASVHWMNLAILAMAAIMSTIFGLMTYLLVQGTALLVAGSIGFWLFYVQHQFEGVYWERRNEWDFAAAALQGSSFYKLPRVLQWFSGNIGFHHIHHLNPRIPNYHLEQCHNANPLFKAVKAVTLSSSLRSLTFRLWDEERCTLIGYRDLRIASHPSRSKAAC